MKGTSTDLIYNELKVKKGTSTDLIYYELKVKKGTSTDLICNELKRADITSRIKDSQWKFYQRLLSLNLEDALDKSFMMFCSDTPMITYCNSQQKS